MIDSKVAITVCPHFGVDGVEFSDWPSDSVRYAAAGRFLHPQYHQNREPRSYDGGRGAFGQMQHGSSLPSNARSSNKVCKPQNKALWGNS